MHRLGRKFTIGVIWLLCCCPLWAAGEAQAIDFKITGQWQILFEQSNVMPRGVQGKDEFGAVQRFAVGLTAIANENLSGTTVIRMGRTEWGQASTGGALGSDGKEVKLFLAWLDWKVPHTDVKVRMGIQPLELPSYLGKISPAFGQIMPGVSVNVPLWEGGDGSSGSLTAFWARPYNDNSSTVYPDDPSTVNIDNLDVFSLLVPMRWEKFRFSPWVLGALIGKYSLTGLSAPPPPQVAPRGGLMPVLGDGLNYPIFQNTSLKSLDRPWGEGFWGSLMGDYDVTDNFNIALEGIYGYVNMGDIDNYHGFSGSPRTFHVRRQGWYVGTKLSYATEFGTPGLMLWYGSGDDDNPWNGSERMPQFNSPFMVTTLGFGGGAIDETTWKVLGNNPAGLMAAVAEIKDVSFVPKLKHKFAVAGYVGTNSPKMPKRANMSYPTRVDGPAAYLTTMDTAWEVNLISDYQMYENLKVNLEAAYVRLNLSDDVWHGVQDSQKKDNYRISMLFTYSF